MSNNEIKNLLEKYQIKDICEWQKVNADLIITDPPFGINFDEKNHYYRKADTVLEGYIEWKSSNYEDNIKKLLKCIKENLNQNGQALIFSGYLYSNVIHNQILKSNFYFQGKLYWIYNFAVYAKKRPAMNVYEIFWITKNKKWTYNERCSTSHCQSGEKNLASLFFKRKPLPSNMPKYPTRLPINLLQCLIEHFSNPGDLIFDPLSGSGSTGIAANLLDRDFLLGDRNPNGRVAYEYLLRYHHLNNKKINYFDM
jgi:site-specific DNA-methyltransferase (adenine-specific)